MIRNFLRDTRGNYAVLAVIAMVPIMGALALAVDYAEVSRQREATRNALDAANMAVARQMLQGTSDEPTLKRFAEDFFKANLGPVSPANAPLTVTFPANNFGGGTLKLETNLKYKPMFLPVAAALLNQSSKDVDLSFHVISEVRLKNTLEVALVLDNSGSMAYLGSGTGQKRIDLLKAASKQLVDKMADQAAAMKQINEPVRFGLVPFAAAVNVAPDTDDQSWLDTEGLSPIHHENFDWSKMTAANAPLLGNRYAEFSGGTWRKRGTGWGDTVGQPLTRFSLYQDMVAQTDREEIPNTKRRVCKKSSSKCDSYTYEPDYEYTIAQYTSWQGCVEARPAPYNNNDAPASKTEPATLFVPMFAPDEAKHLWRDLDNDNIYDLNGDSFDYSNNWWADWEDSDATSRQRDVRKYFRVKPYDASPAGSGAGPNLSCTTNPITPLADVSVQEGRSAIKAAIDDMAPSGNTNVPEGTAWGWRVVSSGPPFTNGRKDGERGNDKVVIVLTDGANTYTDLGNTDAGYAKNRSTYAAYGYTGQSYDGTGVTRMFLGTSSSVGKTNYTASNYQAAMDEQMQAVCANAKGPKARNEQGAGNDSVIVMTVALDLSPSKDDEKKAIEALKSCSSYSRTTVGKKLFWNATGANLMQVFKEIADELSNLRIVS
ncbi:pilus assembly protein TadG-related protein [Aminobacter sp. HY435]|uniref:pilus assembly protein TadG-related protein n=1 Tax=Aminobacter sp. HY435 TaxID=2970917 RepID=UPI0022B9C5AB|nr:TadE/TadG family type IV pilus assembly protein [Aminobacter sp. HY435]